MTTYDSERHYVKVQLSSYRSAKKELKKIIETFLETSLPDFRGDDEKIFSALQASIKFIDSERKEFYNRNKHHLVGEDRD
jgi:hypothetical protein